MGNLFYYKLTLMKTRVKHDDDDDNDDDDDDDDDDDRLVVACVFSGLSLNVSNLGGDVYLNFFLTSIAEIIGFLLCMPLLDRVGRKPVYIVSLLSGGIALVLTIFPILYGQPGDYCLKNLLDMVSVNISVLTIILCKQVTIAYRKLLDMVKVLPSGD